MEFEYAITLKHDIAVITLTGDMVKESKTALEKLHQELLTLKTNLCIFYFKEITVLEHYTHKDLSMIQHELRKQKAEICIFGLDPKMKTHLVEKGIIRSGEVKKDLAEALGNRLKSDG